MDNKNEAARAQGREQIVTSDTLHEEYNLKAGYLRRCVEAEMKESIPNQRQEHAKKRKAQQE